MVVCPGQKSVCLSFDTEVLPGNIKVIWDLVKPGEKGVYIHIENDPENTGPEQDYRDRAQMEINGNRCRLTLTLDPWMPEDFGTYSCTVLENNDEGRYLRMKHIELKMSE